MTLAEINDELGAARTNKKEFLEKLEAIIPWELMLRIFILQNVYNLADMALRV